MAKETKGAKRPRTGEERFAAYLDAIAAVVGHSRRAAAARAYCTGLLLPGERKSIEGLPHVWGSGSGCKGRVGVVRWRESLPEAGAEGAVVDGAANLQQKIGTTSAPAHLLRLVHPAVHQEVGRPFGDGRPNPQAGAVTLGVIDRPVRLADQIAVQRQQRRPQLPRRWHARGPLRHLALEGMHHLADALDADLGIFGFAVPQAPAQPIGFRDDHHLRLLPR